jgi:energy-coupling factor transporter ATP-binding protein EcfA2
MQLDIWTLIVGASVVIGIVAGIVQILGYLRKDPPLAMSRLRLAWTRPIRKFLIAELEEIGSSFATGSNQIRYRDLLFQDDLYIQPRWENYQGTPSSGELTDFLKEKVKSGDKVLLVGESGQGKSTVLKRLFVTLADDYIHRRSRQVPIYIKLRELYAFTSELLTLNSLWAFLKGGNRNPFPLEFEQFDRLARKKQIIFIFDGFDEIQSSPSQNVINMLASSKIFSFTSVLSCRITFYETYLRISHIQEIYQYKVRLKNLKFEQVHDFILAFCQHTHTQNPQVVIDTITESNALMEITKRSLLLVMILDMMTESGLQGKTLRSSAELYEEYTCKWLMAESRKPGVMIIGWGEKHDLMKILAWEMQKNPQETQGLETNWSVSISKSNLIEILRKFLEQPLGSIYSQWPMSTLLNDICHHSFLAPSKTVDIFYFSHKSFQEFYAAKYVFSVLKTNPQAVEQALSEHLPVEIASFLKEMLKSGELNQRDQKQIEKNLEQSYTNNLSSKNSLLREQASYYLACLGNPQAVRFLEEIYPREPDKFVQRGILVGLAILCQRQDILNDYIHILHQDPQADSINLGYHLMYYGDSPFEADYFDWNHYKCDGTLRAIVRHLKDEKYRCGWALDLLTLRRLIETRDTRILAEQDLMQVRTFLNQQQHNLHPSFKQEKDLIEALLMRLYP